MEFQPTTAVRPARVAPLDALRALAILLVLGRHLPEMPVAEMPGWLRAFCEAWQRVGWVGVDLFFTLSGYLISGLLFREAKELGRIDWVRFFVRRGFRIYPPFFFLLLVTALVAFGQHKHVPWTTWLSEMLFIQNYGPALFPHSWSLAVEEHFYLLLPLLLWGLMRLKGRIGLGYVPWLFALIAVLCLAARVWVASGTEFSYKLLLFPTHLRMDSLFFGVFLSYLQHFKQERLQSSVHAYRIPLALAAGVMFLPAFLIELPTSKFLPTIGLTFLYAGSGILLLLCASSAAPAKLWIKPFAVIGACSYSIYLWHIPVRFWGIEWLKAICPLSPLAAAAAYAVISIGFGMLMAWLVERPSLVWRDRWLVSRTDARAKRFPPDSLSSTAIRMNESSPAAVSPFTRNMKKLLLLFLTLTLAALFGSASKARAAVSFDFFYENLDPYGEWVEVADYGYAWHPSNVDENWAPYTDGYWAYTDGGWTWVSYEDFGGITYHYGRWTQLESEGWCWVPDYEWAPAWVSWRTSDDYVGWAPLPPRAHFTASLGIGGWADVEFGIGPSHYNFCEFRNFGEPALRSVIIERNRNVTIINKTTNITNITVNKTKNVFVGGPQLAMVSQKSTRPIQQLKLKRQTDVAAMKAGGGKLLAKQQGDELLVPAPEVTKGRGKAKPAKIGRNLSAAKVDDGWNGVKDPKEKQKLQALQKDEIKGREKTPAKQMEPEKLSTVATDANPPVDPSAGLAKGKGKGKGKQGGAAAVAPQTDTPDATTSAEGTNVPALRAKKGKGAGQGPGPGAVNKKKGDEESLQPFVPKAEDTVGGGEPKKGKGKQGGGGEGAGAQIARQQAMQKQAAAQQEAAQARKAQARQQEAAKPKFQQPPPQMQKQQAAAQAAGAGQGEGKKDADDKKKKKKAQPKD